MQFNDKINKTIKPLKKVALINICGTSRNTLMRFHFTPIYCNQYHLQLVIQGFEKLQVSNNFKQFRFILQNYAVNYAVILSIP